MRATETVVLHMGIRANCVFSLATVIGAALLAAFLIGCAPSSSPGGADGSPASAPADRLELTDDMIRARINDNRILNVPEETGAGEPIVWTFKDYEPKEITIVEKKVEGDRATVILDIRTQTSPRSRPQRQLAGQVRTEWRMETGLLLRHWEVDTIENISMKYSNLLTPPAEQPSP